MPRASPPSSPCKVVSLPASAHLSYPVAQVPTRGLLGYRSIFFTDTRGTGILTRAFKGYEPYKGDLENIRKGVLVSMKTGDTTLYSLGKLQARGELFVNPGTEVTTHAVLTVPNTGCLAGLGSTAGTHRTREIISSLTPGLRICRSPHTRSARGHG